MALALYRKYRPKKFSDVVGQDTNVLILQNAAKQDRIGHAYLFYGPRGTGKTTTARLVAKLLNCQRRETDKKFHDTGEPCNECTLCKEIDSNNSMDVVEIDAASNRGIDEIRNLKESIGTTPATGKYKVYIIDETHMLTGAAFNALLKTLEEPPPHGVLILATTEYEKVPATIISRTQRFLFKKLTKQSIVKKLEYIVKAENIAIEAGALELIAASAQGSFRDAESLLDQIRSLGESIDTAAVEQMTGRVGLAKIEKLAGLILNRDLKKTLTYLSELSEEGDNPVTMTKDLIHYLRKVVSLKTNPSLASIFEAELSHEELTHVQKLSETATAEFIIDILNALLRAYSQMRYSPFAAIPLEIALIEHLQKEPN